MKPIKLVMSAFGPYAEEMPPIEFDKFEEKGLFLITGDTGAGKTTIFDAISFALFGTASGEYRNTANFRCESAPEDVKSYVDFYFSHQGKNYRIHREPSYIRENKNGKMAEVSENVIFYPEGEESIEGLRNVDGSKTNPGVIQNLLHIDADQFKQVAMIAQGEFLKLLNTRTTERTEILRRIFDTDGYKNMEYKLKMRSDAGRAKKEDAEKSILQYFAGVKVSNDMPSAVEYEKLRQKVSAAKAVWNADELVDSIAAVREEDQHACTTKTAERSKEEELLKSIDAELTMAKSDNELLRKVEKLTEEDRLLRSQENEIAKLRSITEKEERALYKVNFAYKELGGKKDALARIESRIVLVQNQQQSASEDMQKAEAAYEEAVKKTGDVKTWNDEVLFIEKDLDKYSRRDKLQKEMVQHRRSQAELKAADESLVKEEAVLQNEIKKLTERIREISDVPDLLIPAEKELSDFAAFYTTAEDILRNKVPDYQRKESDYRKQSEAFLTADKAYLEAVEKTGLAQKILVGCQAYEMASCLEEGDPCPVCGSVLHLKMAEKPMTYVTEEDLKKYQNDESAKASVKEKAFELSTQAKKDFEIAGKILTESLDQCLSNSFFEGKDTGSALVEKADFLQANVTDIKTHGSELQNRVKDLRRLNAELSAGHSRLDKAHSVDEKKLKERRDDLNQKRSELDHILTEAETSLKTLPELPFASEKEAKDHAADLRCRINAAEKEKNDREADKKSCAEKVSGLKGQLGQLNTDLETARREVKASETQFKETLTSQQFASEEEFLSYLVDEIKLKEHRKQITDYEDQVKEMAGRLKTAEEAAKDKVYKDETQLTEKASAQRRLVDQLKTDEHDISQRLSDNEVTISNIRRQQVFLEKYSKEYELASRLYKLTAGQTGNGKITLEQYVQAVGFDRIISAANRRLMPMTSGQFEMYRNEDSLGRKSNKFLDLEVMDNFTGHHRPVGNLSGGESFKASLSLALGLSDTVSSDRGGVQMDALFIDEGFGTLDKKSIADAIDVLVNLAGSNKLVGVISHREELQEITQQIHVTKDAGGSRMTVEGVL